MRFTIVLADLGEGMAQAEIVHWLVAVGDTIRADQPVVTVETDKMMVDVPSPVAGEVIELAGAEGVAIGVGQPLLYVEVADAPAAVTEEDAPVPPAAAPEAPVASVAAASSAAAAPRRSRAKAAPAVRKLALEQGVDIQRLDGTGPGGRVTREDVLAAAAGDAAVEAEPAAVATETAAANGRMPLRGMRKTIAQNLAESWRRIPQAMDLREVDATRLLEARRAAADWAQPASVSIQGLIVKIAAIALARHPLFNSSLDEDASEVVVHELVDVGIATATPDGLAVPVVHDVSRKTAAEVSAEIEALAARARERALRAEDLRGGTFTVNNTGALAPVGGAYPLPLINWPQTAILAFGRIADRVVAVDGQPVVRPTLLLTVNADHRVIDGADLVAFTNDVVALIEQPQRALGVLG